MTPTRFGRLDCCTPTPTGPTSFDFEVRYDPSAEKRMPSPARQECVMLTPFTMCSTSHVETSYPPAGPTEAYAPYSIPLHIPRPVAIFPPVSSLDDNLLRDASEPRVSNEEAFMRCIPEEVECELAHASLHSSPSSQSQASTGLSILHTPPNDGVAAPPPNTFPTPSELLGEMTSRERRRRRKKRPQPDLSFQNLGFLATDP